MARDDDDTPNYLKPEAEAAFESREKPHLFKKGAPSPNPTGRPKQARGLAQMLREQSNDGQMIADALLEIINNKKTKASDRLAAMTLWLSYAYGKPVTSVEISGGVQHVVVPLPLERLSVDELEQFVALETKLLIDGGAQGILEAGDSATVPEESSGVRKE